VRTGPQALDRIGFLPIGPHRDPIAARCDVATIAASPSRIRP
jgi:hypothetical protein